MSTTSRMSIGQAAAMAGVRTSTLRYYESIGLLPQPERAGGRRRYTAEVLRQLAIIQVSKDAGFTLDEVRTLLDGFSSANPPSRQWKEMARRKIPLVEAQIRKAEAMKSLLEDGLECDCLDLNDCTVFAAG